MTRLVPVLGLDPGVHGAAVLLAPDGRSVLSAWSWRRLGRAKKRQGRYAWRVKGHRGAPEVQAPSLSMVGAYIAATAPDLGDGYVIVCEGLFGRGNTLRILAEAAASVYAHLDAPALNDLGAARDEWRPRSREWRRDILGIASEGQVGADACEAYAIEWAAKNITGLGELATVGHVCEAAAIARWAWVKWGHQVRLAEGAR